jgi:hypothetical protein
MKNGLGYCCTLMQLFIWRLPDQISHHMVSAGGADGALARDEAPQRGAQSRE